MVLSNELISQFAKVTKDNGEQKNGITVNGTAVDYNGKIYVRLDGSDQLTPVISSTAGIKNGDRVTVLIKDHSATVTGNTSSPSAGSGDLDDLKHEIGNKITEVEILIADKVSVKEFDAQVGRIDELVSDNIIVKDKLTATNAEIENLKAKDVTIEGSLVVNKAEIEDLKVKKLDADIADLKFATIENLEATNAKIHNLEVDYGDFKDLTTENFKATNAEIKNLDTKYANIDFSNIGHAAMEHFYAQSGLIKDVVIGDATITGELVGVTIKGELLEGGTVVADKLVIKGSDGLYYKLNTDGITTEAEQTDYNSLNGQVIRAKSITATKIDVQDLVAFGATIGGFKITDRSIYSGVKESVDNNTRGAYLDKEGQVAFGDANNFLKYYRDSDGSYKLAISASSISFGAKDTDVETAFGETITSTEEQFYQSDSPTVLSGGTWSNTQPTWTKGKYIWCRTLLTYKNGKTVYSPSEIGVCISGNDGDKGDNGSDSVFLQILSSNGNLFKNSTVSTTLTVTIMVAGESICSSRDMYAKFGENAKIEWEQKRFGEQEFTKLDPSDSRLSDNGFILTLVPKDVYTQTVFNCGLSY